MKDPSRLPPTKTQLMSSSALPTTSLEAAMRTGGGKGGGFTVQSRRYGPISVLTIEFPPDQLKPKVKKETTVTAAQEQTIMASIALYKRNGTGGSYPEFNILIDEEILKRLIRADDLKKAWMGEWVGKDDWTGSMRLTPAKDGPGGYHWHDAGHGRMRLYVPVKDFKTSPKGKALGAFGVSDTIALVAGNIIDVAMPSEGDRIPLQRRRASATPEHPKSEVTIEELKDAITTVNRAKDQMGDDLMLQIVPTTGLLKATMDL